jgi:hypothetical protein
MSIDPFSQAFTGTDWAKLAQVQARPAPGTASARPAAVVASANAAASGPAGAAPKLAGAPARAATAGASPGSGQAAAPGSGKDSSQDDGFLTFNDVIDIINPLQHIPVVSAIYRHFTGDTQRPQGEILGGFLYGGLIGGAAATASVFFHDATGIDPGEEVIAFLTGDESHGASPGKDAAPAPSQLAVATPAAPSHLAAATPAAPSHGAAAPVAATGPAGGPSAPSAPAPASAENRLRNQIAASNQSALQMLAQDMAGGGQQMAQASAASAAGTPPLPGRVPFRSVSAGNGNPPPGLIAPQRQYAAYTRPSPLSALPPGGASAAPPGGASAQAPAGAALPAAPATPPAGAALPASPPPRTLGPRPMPRPAVVIPAGIATSAGLAHGTSGPLNNTASNNTASNNTAAAGRGGAGSSRPANRAGGSQTTLPAPGQPVPLDVVPALMMHNLDKYQAMSAAQTRTRSQPPHNG